MKEKERISKLREDIKKHNDYYYKENKSLISDVEYDKLIKELQDLEEDFPEYKEINSPTEVVGSSLRDNKFNKVTHTVPMLSLSNSYNEKDIENFIERIDKRLLNNEDKLEYVLELKLDGLSISVIYEDGLLKRAVTRGDGVIGEDVTENIIEIESIPKKLNENLSIEVRGEVVLPISKFESLNKERVKNGLELFANPRNAASGTLRQIDATEISKRGLDAYFYYLVDGEKYGNKTHLENMKFIENLGIKTTKIFEVLKNSKEIKDRVDFWDEKRKEFDFETDGLVIKLNEINLWEKLGSTSKSPRWAIAYKFPATQITTTIKDVTWQVGRTGKITPVAELEEVELSGSKVKRASLHNLDEIERKDIRIGDKVFIEKAAEIIPQVVKSIKDVRTGKEVEIKEPTLCPSCGSDLVREEDRVDIKCVNDICPGKIQGEIEYFVSRDAMNISGFGSKIVEKLLNLNFISDVTDIYNLKDSKDKLEELDKMGKKSIENLLSSIEESKKRDYSKVIYSLGIPNVGKTTAKLLSEISGNIETLMNMTIEELENIDGIGAKGAKIVFEFLRNSKNIKIIEKLKSHGLQFSVNTEDQVKDKSHAFYGKKFLFTGTLKNYTREEMKEEIEKLGGINLSSVSKKLDYLIVGENAGKKLEKAKEIGNIEILSEDEFIILKDDLTN